MPMPERNIEGEYRYAYQGQEKDPETGMEAFELRLWDARIGRWLTTDPAGQFHSSYLGMGNNPINGIDPVGGLFGRIRAWTYKLFNEGSIFKNDYDQWVWSSGVGEMTGDMNSGFNIDIGSSRNFGYGGLGKISYEMTSLNVKTNLDVGFQNVNDKGISGYSLKALTFDIASSNLDFMNRTSSFDYIGKNGEVKGRLMSMSSESTAFDAKAGFKYTAKDFIRTGLIYGKASAATIGNIMPTNISLEGKAAVGRPFLEGKMEVDSKKSNIKIHLGFQEEWSKSYGLPFFGIGGKVGFNSQVILDWKL